MSTRRELRKAREEIGELLESHGADRGLEEFSRYENDPVGFVRDVLGADPWTMQEEIAEALLTDPLVTVRSCHASGKDWLAARLALWWTYALRGLVVLTGPTATQVEEILMRGEVREAFGGSDLPGELHVKALRPDEEGKAGILAKTATGVSALTGFHETRVLFCITEAQDPEIGHAWDAAFACTTGAEDRILTLGNPTERAGRFYQAHRETSDWRSFKIEASDIPNVRKGRTVVPGLLTREGVRRFAREYGEQSGFYKSRVLAEFPEQAEEGLIRRSWLEAAADRFESRELHAAARDEEPVVGVDVGRRGPDKTIAAIRRGPVLQEIREVGNRNPTKTADRVEEVLQEVGFYTGDEYVQGGTLKKVPKRGRVVVDTLGVGARVADPLQEAGYDVTEYKGSLSPGRPQKYANLRAESYWHLRNLLEDGEIALPRDEELFEELLAISWSPTGQGKIQMEAKADVKKKIRRSPDRADAVAMAFHPEGQGHTPPPTVDEIGVLQK